MHWPGTEPILKQPSNVAGVGMWDKHSLSHPVPPCPGDSGMGHGGGTPPVGGCPLVPFCTLRHRACPVIVSNHLKSAVPYRGNQQDGFTGRNLDSRGRLHHAQLRSFGWEISRMPRRESAPHTGNGPESRGERARSLLIPLLNPWGAQTSF